MSIKRKKARKKISNEMRTDKEAGMLRNLKKKVRYAKNLKKIN